MELRVELKTRADDEAITIFGRNLEQLLLSSPAGEKRVVGLEVLSIRPPATLSAVPKGAICAVTLSNMFWRSVIIMSRWVVRRKQAVVSAPAAYALASE